MRWHDSTTTASRQRGGELKLVQVNKRVADLVQIKRLNTLFEIYGEEQVTLRAFQTGA